jgi:hypothetical protein
MANGAIAAGGTTAGTKAGATHQARHAAMAKTLAQQAAAVAGSACPVPLMVAGLGHAERAATACRLGRTTRRQRVQNQPPRHGEMSWRSLLCCKWMAPGAEVHRLVAKARHLLVPVTHCRHEAHERSHLM